LTAGVGKNFTALADVALSGKTHAEQKKDALVVLFMRGGADGLNMVAPYADDDYHRLRPTLALARPKDRRTPSACALDLDGFFGLHPSLAPLQPLYKEGLLAVAHGVGSGDKTRSHFEAMATMERGLAQQSGAASGWLARHLQLTAEDIEPPLRAVSITDTVPDSLRGATSVVALTSLQDFRLKAPVGTDGKNFHSEERATAFTETLRALYSDPSTPPQISAKDPYQLPMPLERAGQETLAAMEAIRRLDPAHYAPSAPALYPDTPVGNGFRQVACLLKGDVGMEIAFLESHGWDTHITQGRETGFHANLLDSIGKTLAAFTTDMGKKMNRVTVLVMTEFGRRSYENYSLGTDHGRASCLFLIGGGVIGGKVYANWGGLAQDKLEDGVDLKVTTDYRDILAEVLHHRLKNKIAAEVFPGYTPHFIGMTKPLGTA
jgi:uncharacterized protein (DUF1501 family)